MLQSQRKFLKVSRSGVRVISQGDPSPLELCEPEWVPDKQSVRCTRCQGRFSFTCRKHHCRRCGKCFCGRCCSDKVALRRMNFIDPVLHCTECAQVSKTEKDFFETELPIVLKGELLNVCIGECVEGGVPTFCKLSPSHKTLNFVPASRSALLHTEGIDLLALKGCVVGTLPDETISSVKLLFLDSHAQLQAAYISSCPSNNNYTQQRTWLRIFHKCSSMLEQARREDGCMNVEN